MVDAKEKYEMGGETIRALGPAETVRYLGVEVGYFGAQFTAETTLTKGLENIKKAPLKPQQRPVLLKHYLIPRMLHTMVLSATKRKDLVAADFKIRCALRNWLHLPKDTPLAYIYARVKDGGLGVMEFRSMIPVLKRKRLEELRTSSHPYREKLVDSERWMQILKRTKPVKEEGITMDSKEKVKEVMRTQLYQKVDGAGLKHAGEVPSAHKWVDDGSSLMSGGAYVAAVKIRGNLMATTHRSTRGRGGDRLCDAGCRRAETFAQISQVCPRTWAP